MGLQHDGHVGRDSRSARTGEETPERPRGGVGAHHDGNAGEEHSRNKLPDPGEAWRGRSQPGPTCYPWSQETPLSSQDAQEWLV